MLCCISKLLLDLCIEALMLDQCVTRPYHSMCTLQETAKLYEQAELHHVYKGQYAAEYEMTRNASGWKLMDSTITF